MEYIWCTRFSLFTFRLKKFCRKPISRILFQYLAVPAPIIYLVLSLRRRIHLPTLLNFFAKTRRAALPGQSPIEVYLTFQPTRFIHTRYCYRAACALTTRFHLFRPDFHRSGSFFSVTLSVHCSEPKPKAAAHPLDGVALYVVRTFLTLICTSPR